MPRSGQKLFRRDKWPDFLDRLRSLSSEGPCVVWPGTTGSDYGRVWVDGHKIPASRYVYEELQGPLSASLNVCHTCDNPPCVRPGHLWAGTDKDNLADAAQKGRMHGPGPYRRLRGEQAPNARLSDADVVMIRALSGVVGQKQIARRFGIGQSQVSRIVRGQSRVC